VKLTLAYVRASTLELLRYPAFSLPTLLFPTLIFVLFAASRSEYPEHVMAGFAAIAVLGVVFFQFGVGIAADRMSAWEVFLRTLPVSPHVRVGARVASALAFATASAGLVIATATITTPVTLPISRWPLLAVGLFVGAVPFALLGIALGYLVWPKAALPVANLLYLPLSFLGGLWTGPRDLPDFASEISVFVPTRAWGDVLWGAIGSQPWSWWPPFLLAIYTVAFGVLAAWGYRRDEGERFN
jgi:ABC-2 type transport system permease protein